MTLEVASYIAGIIAAVAGLGSLYYSREQHRKSEKTNYASISNPVQQLPAQEPDSTTDQVLESAISSVEVAEVTKGVPTDFVIAFESARSMFSKSAGDAALKILVEKALGAKHIEFAITVAAEMFSKSAKDEALTQIVKHALRENSAQLAHRASELFFSMSSKDAAKKLIIDWVRNEKA